MPSMDNMVFTPQENMQKMRPILEAMAEALRPRPKLTPSQWAEKNITLAAGNAIPGKICFDNAPYQREPLDCYGRKDVHKITLMFGAQTGKTTIMNAGIGYAMECKPQSQMMMQPTETDIQIWLETKMKPMIKSSHYLNKVVAKPRSREGVNNNKMMSYPGGYLMFAWAGSPNTIHGRSAPKINADEVDRYEILKGQGHPVSLLEQRSATFGDDILVAISSTPTLEGVSYVGKSYNAGDQREWHVPCHECGYMQSYKWEQVIFDKDENGAILPKTARYMCENCGSHWTDRDKIKSNKKGDWIATKPFDGHASFHMSELGSNFRTWEQIVRSYMEKEATGDLQTFWNVSLGLPFEDKTGKMEPDLLQERAYEFDYYIPDDVIILTAGIDIQPDRIEAELVGWTGENRQSYSIEYAVFYGDVELPEKHPDSLWAELTKFLYKNYTNKKGVRFQVACSFIDSGDGNTAHNVYDYVLSKRARKIFAIKGVKGWNIPIVRKSRAEKPGISKYKKRKSFPLILVAVNEAKMRVYRDLYVENDDQAGYCHFPHDREPEYFKMLTAEKTIKERSKSGTILTWVKIRSRNEALDCRVYALAALLHLKPNYTQIRARIKGDILTLEQQKEKSNIPDVDIETTQKSPSQKKATRIIRGTRKIKRKKL